MAFLLQHLWVGMALCAVLGFIVGRWIWYRDAEAHHAAAAGMAAPYIPPAPPEAEIEPEPEIEPELEIGAVETEEPPPAEAAEPDEVGVEPAGADPEPDPVVEPEPATAPDREADAAAAASPFLAAPDGEPDDLTRIKGVGPKLNDLLHSLGVFHYSQIAGWSEAQVTEVDSYLDTFRGRIARDRWIDQARYLAAGDIAGFEHEFGPIGNRH